MQKALRNRIKTLLEEYFVEPQDYSQSLMKDITYLKDFELKSSGNEGIYDYWIYYFDTHGEGYKIICAVTKESTADIWSFKSEIYWVDFDKKKSPGTGMEYTIDVENINGYEEFINTLNRKLHNSPLVNSDMYHDDYNFMMTKEVVKELIKLIIAFPKIEALDNSQFYEPLKKLYHDTIDLSVEDTIDYIQDNYPADGDKQMLIYKLNSMDSLDNFTEIQKLNMSPRDETIV